MRPSASLMRHAGHRARARAGLLSILVAALLGGCAQLVPQTIALRTGWPAGVPQTAQVPGVPFFPQEEFQCGPAALATVLAHSGVPVTPDPLTRQVFLPERKGSLQLEMLAAPRRYERISYQLAPRYADVLREVAAGHPVVVLQDVGPGPPFVMWHYAVIYGFDYPSGTLYLRSGTDPRREMPFTAFERDWMKSNYWAMVVLPPDQVAATADEDSWMKAVIAMSRVSGPDAALKANAAALKRWPDNLAAAIGLANAHYARGAFADAARVLREAQARHPESAIVTNNLAQVLSDMGRHNEALALIDKAADPQGAFAADIKSTRQMILQRLAQQKAGNRR